MDALTICNPYPVLILDGRKPPASSPADRVLRRVRITEHGCWEFQGSRQRSGHGLVGVGKRAERFRYTAENARDAILGTYDGMQHCSDREQKQRVAEIERVNRKRW